MKKLILIALTVMGLLSACNTIAGAGQNIGAAGNSVSNAADNIKAKM